jgi:hypothetical protein
MLYAVHPTDRAGAVIETGANLVKLVGMSPTVFSRTRRQVVEADGSRNPSGSHTSAVTASARRAPARTLSSLCAAQPERLEEPELTYMSLPFPGADEISQTPGQPFGPEH